MKNIELIIYDNTENFNQCIDAIKNNTDINNNKLNLFYEKNPDFVNSYVKNSTSDFVFMSSDIIVSKNWLNLLLNCANKNSKIATVTPLLYNNEMNSFSFENITFSDYPEIPIYNSLFFLIKKEAFDIIDYYENKSDVLFFLDVNFNYKCISLGFSHILCDDLLLYQKQSPKKNEQTEYINNYLDKYYLFNKNILDWESFNPINYLNLNIEYNAFLNNGKSNILYIIHDWELNPTINKQFGGSTLHTYDLINSLKHNYNFHVLAPYENIYRLYSYYNEKSNYIDLYTTVSQLKNNIFYNSEYMKMLSNIIDFFSIDIIHIQHLRYHYFNITDIKSTRNIKLFITLHDYYTICPMINNININYDICTNTNEIDCNYCLSNYSYYNLFFENINFIRIWKKKWHDLLLVADKIIVPSLNTKHEISNCYNDLSIDIIEHGIMLEESITKLSLYNDNLYNIALLGNLSIIKGKLIIEELVKYSYEAKGNYNFHLFGMICSDILPGNYDNFINHNNYDRKDLKILLFENNIKLICIFSIWRETFCYTFFESIANGIPVLAIDEGVVGDKVRKNNLGWLIKKNTSIPEIFKIINNIFSNKEEYDKVINSIHNYKVKSLFDMSQEYEQLYNNYKSNRINNIENRKQFIKENCLLKNIVQNVNNPSYRSIIYYDTGSGFNSNEYMSTNVRIQNNFFELFLKISPEVKKIRFDPFEGYSFIIQNLKIISNNGEIKYTFSNCIEINGIFLFDSNDPQIIINIKEISTSQILISANIQLFESYNIITKLYKELLSERNSLLTERSAILSSKSWRLTKPLRYFMSLFKRNLISQ